MPGHERWSRSEYVALPGVFCDRVQVLGGWRRCGVWVAGSATGDHIRKRGAVPYGPGHSVRIYKTFQRVSRVPAQTSCGRGAVSGRQGRNTTRAPGSSPCRRRRTPRERHGGHRGGRSSARSAGGDRRRPRIDRRAEQRGLGGAVIPPLRGVRLAEYRQSRRQVAVDDPRGLRRHVGTQRSRAHRLRVPASEAPRSFSRNGTPANGPDSLSRVPLTRGVQLAACSRPRSNMSRTTALRSRAVSSRMMAASSSSCADNSPARTSAA